MESLLTFPVRRPKTVIAAILAVTVLAVVALVSPGVGMNANPYPLQRSHPSMVAYQQLKQDYTGTGETALIHLRHPETLYNPGTLERVARLTEALEQVTIIRPQDSDRLAAYLPQLPAELRTLAQSVLDDGITRADDLALTELQTKVQFDGEPAPGFADALNELRLKLYPVREVTSLANVEHIVATGDDLKVGKVYETVPRDAAGLQRVADAVRDNRVFQRLLVSDDGRSTGIQVETYIPDSRSDLMFLIYEEISRLLAEYPGPERTDIAGQPVMSATAISTMQGDNATFFPAVILIVLAILWLTFRSLLGMVLPMAVVVISVIWTVAAMAVLGVQFNILTTALPVFLITIGVADGIHLVSDFRDRFREHGKRALAAGETMRQLGLPVIMTSLTTGAGFLSLAYTDISNIQEFGLLVALGVLFAMVFSLTFVPAVLSLGKDHAPAQERRRRVPQWGAAERARTAMARVLDAVGSISVHRAAWIVSVSALLAAVGVVGLVQIQPENDFVTYFRKEMPIVRATHALDDHLAGSNVVNVIVSAQGTEEEPFKDPARLAVVEGLQRRMETLPTVGKSLSLVDILERINRVLHQDNPAYDRLPGEENGVPGRSVVAQYLLLYENGGGDNLTDLTDSRFETMNVRLSLSTRSTTEIAVIMDAAQAYAKAHFPAGMSLRFAGAAELVTASNNEVVRGQMISFSASLVLILLLLLVEFRSVSKGLLAMIPLAITALFNFGVMGLFGVHLNIGTAIVSSISIGIGVDFAIHYLSRLQHELPSSASLEEAVQRTMRASGKAIVANAFTVSLGFVALFASNMIPLRQVGWMVSQTLMVSMVATLLLMPAAIAMLRPTWARQPADTPVPAPAAA